MFQPAGPGGYTSPLPKILQKTLVHGDKTLMTEFRLEKGAELPRHSHPHEQTGYLVSGLLKLTIDNETYEVVPGDSWSIPGGVEHEAMAAEETLAIEVFSPVREDYLP